MKNTQKNKTLFALTETAMMAALSIGIFLISDFIPWPSFLQGGSVTLFGQVPIIILSYRRGVKYGLCGGFILAVFELIMGLSNFSYVKTLLAYAVVALFDYIIPFTCLGLGGYLRKTKLNDKLSVLLGSLTVCAIRFMCHFFSGFTVWRDYTKSLWGSIAYSFTYNLSYMLPETVITVIGAFAVISFIHLKKGEGKAE